MSEFHPFPCGECGHLVQLAAASGRTYEYMVGYKIPIPDDFHVPTCPKCGEIYILPEIGEKLNPILRKSFLRIQADHYSLLVKILMLRHNATKKDIVRACGVTPSYLSHVLAGKRQASVTLTRLMESFVANSSEFERHLNRRPWTYDGVFPLPVRSPNKGFSHGHVEWTPVNDNKDDVVESAVEVA